MAEPEDLARGIAENVGYMPMVNKAGEMGSSFLDFLGSLMGGGKAQQAPARAQPQQAQQPGFLGGLLNAIMSGAQGTADAFNRDVSKVSEGKLPPELMKDASTAMMMTGRGGFGPGLAKVPATRSVQKVFDPAEGWKEINEVVTPSMDPIKSLLQGSPNQFTNLLLKLLQLNRQNTGGIAPP